jgi:hypothetical protein
MVFAAPDSARAGIDVYCENSFVSNNVNPVDPGNLDSNDVYLRYAAAQYLGHEPGNWALGYHVLAWISRPQATGRVLELGMVRDFDSRCGLIPTGPTTPGGVGSPIEVTNLPDINWVHHGGHVPRGQVGDTAYPSHGYLVWSSTGSSGQQPRFSVARFLPILGGWGSIDYRTLPFYDAFSPSEHPRPRRGMLPAMASNQPFPGNQDSTVSVAQRILCMLAAVKIPHIPGLPPPVDFSKYCDYGHRLLLVYSDNMSWVTSPKKNPDTNKGGDLTPFWIGSRIRYILFRPGDYRIISEGTLFDVAQHDRSYDPQMSHAFYPEVVWDEANRRWITFWETREYNENPDDPEQDPRWENIRYARIVDEQGQLGQLNKLGVCNHGLIPTARGLAKQRQGDDDLPPGDDEPPAEPIQLDYCYYINVANDYHSAAGRYDWVDRNDGHYTFMDGYMWNLDDPEKLKWLEPTADEYVDNLYDQAFQGGNHKSNIAVIDWPFTDRLGYPDASYLMFKADTFGGPNSWRNEFFLVVNEPDDAFSPPTYPGQVQDQQYYFETAGAPEPNLDKRVPWALSGNLYSFMALYAQRSQTTGWEMRYGNYYYYAE